MSLYISLGYLQYSGHSGHLLQAEIGKKCSYEGYEKYNSFYTGERLMWIVTLEETVSKSREENGLATHERGVETWERRGRR